MTAPGPERPDPAAGARGAPQARLLSTSFRRLWLAQGVSTFGSLVTRAALPFTAVLALHASAAQMALLAAVSLVTGALVAPLAGPWLDRARRRPVMIACDLARALLLACIPLAAFAHRLDFGVLLAVQAAEGALTTVFDVAQRSWLPELVGTERLGEANARLASTDSVAEISAFGVAGWIVQWLGGPLAMALDALSYVGSAVALGGIRAREGARTAAAGAAGAGAWLRESRDGLAAAFADPALRALALAEAFLFLKFGVFLSVYTLYAARELALPTGPLGMVYGLGGVATLGASVALPGITRRLGTRATMNAGLALGLAGMAIAVLAPAGRPGWALAMLAAQQLVGDGGWLLFLVTAETLRMTLAPEAARARVAAGARALTLLARIAGVSLAASLAPYGSPRLALACGMAAMLPAFECLRSPALRAAITRGSSST